MKCYDWSNKNLRVVEWVSSSEGTPEEDTLYVIRGDIGYGRFYAIAVWTGECWREENREGFAWGSAQVERWLELPDTEEEKPFHVCSSKEFTDAITGICTKENINKQIEGLSSDIRPEWMKKKEGPR